MGANELVISVPPPTYHTATSFTELNKAIVQYMGRSGEVTVKVAQYAPAMWVEAEGTERRLRISMVLRGDEQQDAMALSAVLDDSTSC